ncbi:MAG TPA: SDR family NAD(P)-dependent oxidoreductase, partial [Vicinamibacterales bacterium]
MPGIVLITGGSRGIGAATAHLVASRGYAVCVNYRVNETAARAVVQNITVGGGRAIAVQGDVAIEADVVRLFETCDRELGPLTVL